MRALRRVTPHSGIRVAPGANQSPARRHEYFHNPSPVLSRTSPPFRALYPRGLPTAVASAAVMAPVNGMYAGEDQSWQDVYASYGCSLDFDASDDDG